MKKHNTYMTRVVRDIGYEEVMDMGVFQILYVRNDEENSYHRLLRVLNPLDKQAFAIGDVVTLGVGGGAEDMPYLIIV